MSAVVPIALLGLVVGAYLPGLVARVPAGSPVLARGRAAWLPVGRGRAGAAQAGPEQAGPEQAGTSRSRGLALVLCTAAVFALLAARFGLSAELPAFLFLGAVGVALAAIDLEHHRLPNALTFPTYVVGAAALGAAALTRGDAGPFGRALAGMAVLYAIFYLLMLIYPAGMGFGDVKLAGVLGLYLGWLGWGELVAGAFLGFLLGAVVGLGLMAAGRVSRKSSLPFGPAMLLGALVAIVAGQWIAEAYLRGISG